MCLGGIFDYDGKKEKLEEVSRELEDSAVWNKPERAQALGKERAALEQIVGTIDKLDQGLEDVAGLVELAVEAEDEETFVEAQTELADLEAQLAKLEFRRMFSGKNDANHCFLDIQAGSGGTEAQDWASMLMRMYLRWGEAKGFSPELYEVTDGDVAGIKGCTIHFTGEYAYGWLRTETGVHRLVRKSPFDSGNRRHTSFASVFVYQKLTTTLKLKSIQQICGLIPTARQALVVSTLTGLTLQCGSLTCPPILWCSVRTTVRNTKTVITLLSSCVPSSMSLNCKSKMLKNKRWKIPSRTSDGAVKSARTYWMIHALKTYALA